MTKGNIISIIVGAIVALLVLNILLISTPLMTFVVYPLVGAGLGHIAYLVFRRAPPKPPAPPKVTDAKPLELDELKARGIADEQ